MTVKLPHPIVPLIYAIAVAALLTWVLPAGAYERRDDPATGRRVVVAGTYHRVPAAPVGPFAAIVAIPRGFAEAVDVIAVILLVGGAWVVVDRLGALGRVVEALVRAFRGRGLWAIPLVAVFFATMGALENMQEEIIPLIPVLLVLGRGLGVDAVTMVAASAGAAMIGSAFGPTNPFQAGIALRLAQVPPLAGAGLRLGMLVVGLALWIGWTLRHARRTRVVPDESADRAPAGIARRDVVVLALVLAPMAAYIVGALRFGWGFNELAAVFLIGGVAAGLAGGLGVARTTTTYLEGMQSMLAAAVLVGLARSISVVLTDGQVIDTILFALVMPLGALPSAVSALLAIPLHALLHIVVPSVSGQAVLTMPVLVPLGDLLGQSRQVTVLAYQTGAGLMEMFTPTNGSLMAILLAAGVPYGRWLRFALGGGALALMVGVIGMMIAAAA